MAEEVPVNREPLPGGELFAPVEAVLRRAVEERVFPGAAAGAGTPEGAVWQAGAGRLDYAAGRPADARTVYDLASLTKVIATTSVVMRLHEMGKLALDAPVQSPVPEFRGA